MTVVVGGSSPQITFADSTVQNTAALPLTGGSVSADITVHGLTVGLGGGSVSTNTAVGVSALNANTSGANNTAIGYQAAYSNTSGGQITAVGYQAGYTSNSVGGTYLTAVGFKAAYTSSTTGTICAIGYNALTANTSGADNTAVGSYNALGSNTTGSYNTAVGREALNSNTTASYNTAVGYQAGYTISTGTNNAIFGNVAGKLGNGTYNTFIGDTAGYNTSGTLNALIGQGAGYLITSGSYNTVLGSYSGNQNGLDIRTSSNYIVLSDGAGNARCWFNGSGNPFFNNVGSTASAANMFYNTTSGLISYSTSAIKYKTNVRDLPDVDITKFRPVVYNSLCDGDDKTKDHFGFIADEVDALGYKELVGYKDGQVDSFQYDRMTVVLTQAVKQLLATVTAQATEIQSLKTKVGV